MSIFNKGQFELALAKMRQAALTGGYSAAPDVKNMSRMDEPPPPHPDMSRYAPPVSDDIESDTLGPTHQRGLVALGMLSHPAPSRGLARAMHHDAIAPSAPMPEPASDPDKFDMAAMARGATNGAVLSAKSPTDLERELAALSGGVKGMKNGRTIGGDADAAAAQLDAMSAGNAAMKRDRTVGQPPPAELGYEDGLKDALASMDAMKNDSTIDPSRKRR